jgi:hypothetical protein
VDGAVGGLLVGTAAFLLAATENAAPARRWARIAFPLAGALIGLGRHEWAMAFAAAGLGASLLAAVLRTGRAVLPLGFVAGLAAGVGISLAVSTADYISSFHVMKRVYALPGDHIALLWRQVPWTAPVLLLGLLAAGLIVASLRRIASERPGTVILAAGGTGIAAGFAASGFGGDGFPRYYAPALIALTYAVVALVRGAAWPRSVRRLATGAFAAGILANAWWLCDNRLRDVSITSSPGTHLGTLRAQLARSAERVRAERAIVVEHSSFWLYFPDADFIGRDMGAEGARQFLLANHPHLADRLIMPQASP